MQNYDYIQNKHIKDEMSYTTIFERILNLINYLSYLQISLEIKEVN